MLTNGVLGVEDQQTSALSKNADSLSESLRPDVVAPELPLSGDHSAPTRRERDDRGRMLPGHQVTIKHGLYSALAMESFHEAGALLLADALKDEGEEPSARRRALLEYRCLQIHPNILALGAALRTGLFDKRNKLRVNWVTKLESLISQARAIDSQLGLARRTKAIGDLDAYLANEADMERS